MKHRFTLFLYILLPLQLLAQGGALRSTGDAIPGDNVLRFYRLAIPVTKSAYEEDLDSDYNTVLAFWRECEVYVNNLYVPLGFCFDVIEDERLVLHESGMIDENVYNAPSLGTELLNELIPSSAYDIGMWVTHRDEYEENSGLSIENGAYLNSTKACGYAKTDKWVVAHEIGHSFQYQCFCDLGGYAGFLYQAFGKFGIYCEFFDSFVCCFKHGGIKGYGCVMGSTVIKICGNTFYKV